LNDSDAAGAGAAGSLFVISAPSGAGKTSLTRAVIERLGREGIRAEFSVSYTTREPRAGEREGRDYHFVPEETFLAMAGGGEFLEHAQVFGRRYGTGRAQIEQLLAGGSDVMLDIDWQGGVQVRARMPDSVGVFILPPSRAVLERRLRGRAKDSGDAIRARMRQAVDEMAHYGEYDYLIVNDDFERAADELHAICRARRLRCQAQAEHLRETLAQLLASP
jgi:guanylate kinase